MVGLVDRHGSCSFLWQSWEAVDVRLRPQPNHCKVEQFRLKCFGLSSPCMVCEGSQLIFHAVGEEHTDIVRPPGTMRHLWAVLWSMSFIGVHCPQSLYIAAQMNSQQCLDAK